MNVFAWLDTAASNAFAREISEEFALNFRADAGAASAKGSEQRLQHAIEVLANRAAKFDRQSPLGWYRKARFMSTVKETLAEKGYAAELVDRVVYAVVMRMARRES
jgi:hypothetical protein